MKLIIGCPIYKRDWILPYWFSAIQNQSVSLNDVGFVFVAAEEDKETLDILNMWRRYHPDVEVFDIVIPKGLPHYSHEEGSRQWNPSKYQNMVILRNLLLEQVRKHSPDYFFSLDSDILIKNRSTIELLIAHIKEGADAVSPLMYMTPVGSRFPSVMTWVDEPGGKAKREFEYPVGSYFQSDVIMAAKMMSKNVYENINYKIHPQGEDLGWSHNCAEAGYKLYSASYLYAWHVMGQGMFEDLKKHGDPREEYLLKSLSKV